MLTVRRKRETGSAIVVILAITLLIFLVAGVVPGIRKLKESPGEGQTAKTTSATGGTTSIDSMLLENVATNSPPLRNRHGS